MIHVILQGYFLETGQEQDLQEGNGIREMVGHALIGMD
jgi:hypothetical protein